MIDAEMAKRVAWGVAQFGLSLYAYSAAAEVGARRGIQAERESCKGSRKGRRCKRKRS